MGGIRNLGGRMAGTCLSVLAAAWLPMSASAEENGGTLILDNVRVLDLSGETPSVTQGRSILIEDGRISLVGNADDMPPEDKVQHFDGAGRFLIPGLTDMHVHVWDEAELGAYLAYGVTTVRNLSGMPFHLSMQHRIADGALLGPRLFTSGPILNSQGPNAQINHQFVEDAESARAAVRRQKEAGYDRIKVYSNLRREAYEAIRDEAATLGMTVTGHSPEGFRGEGVPLEKPFDIAFDELYDDNFETFEHVETIVWHALYDDLDEVKGRELAKAIAASGTPVTPTLVAHRNLVHIAETKGAYATRPGTEWLNPVTQQTEQESIAFWASQDPADEGAKDPFYGHFTTMLQEEGVTLVAGSDAGILVNIPGESLHDELDLMVEGGLTPYEALQSATVNAALVLGEEGSSGCIEAGCRADLVLVSCDPLDKIACLRKPDAVIRAGRYIDTDVMKAMLSEAARPDVERTVKNLVEGMAAQGTEIDPAALGL